MALKHWRSKDWCAYLTSWWGELPEDVLGAATRRLAGVGLPPQFNRRPERPDWLARAITASDLPAVLDEVQVKRPAVVAVAVVRALAETHPELYRAEALWVGLGHGFAPRTCGDELKKLAARLQPEELRLAYRRAAARCPRPLHSTMQELAVRLATEQAPAAVAERRRASWPRWGVAAGLLLLASLPVAPGDPVLPIAQPETATTTGAAIAADWAETPYDRVAWSDRLRRLNRTGVSRAALRQAVRPARAQLVGGPGGLWRWRLKLPAGGAAGRLLELIDRLAPGPDYEWRSSVTDTGWRLAARAPTDSPPGPVLRLAFAGDVMYSGDLSYLLKWHGADWPWAPLAPYRDQWDAMVINLETPLSHRTAPTELKRPAEPRAKREFIFNGPLETIRPMAQIGVRAVTIGNNHSIDHGAAGLAQTRAGLAKHGVTAAGAGADYATAAAPALVRAKGLTCAVISFCEAGTLPRPETFAAGPGKPGAALLFGQGDDLTRDSRRKLAAAVQEAQLVAEVVFVAVHWGKEAQLQPTGLQRRIAQLAIDAGADAVVGHHPHCLQPVEWYQGRPICYSLGNFVFSGYRLDRLERSVIARFTVDSGGVVAVDFAPIQIQHCRPHVTTDPALTAWVRDCLVPSARVGSG